MLLCNLKQTAFVLLSGLYRLGAGLFRATKERRVPRQGTANVSAVKTKALSEVWKPAHSLQVYYEFPHRQARGLFPPFPFLTASFSGFALCLHLNGTPEKLAAYHSIGNDVGIHPHLWIHTDQVPPEGFALQLLP